MIVALPFFDDSTLFFAKKVSSLLVAEGVECRVIHTPSSTHGGISERQLLANLPNGPDDVVDPGSIAETTFEVFDAVVISKFQKEIHTLLKNRSYKNTRKKRPKFVAFLPGLEFTPERGFNNRRHCDAIFVNNEEQYHRFKVRVDPHQSLFWGHPYFIHPTSMKDEANGPIYFFAQAISPSTFRARMHIADVLASIAKANPEREVVIKLRHLPEENENHVHKERYDYRTLLENVGDTPHNLRLSVETMDIALSRASVAITCTSTAAMDAVSAGIPTMVYLDYVENYNDPMVAAMSDVFSCSGLITPLESLLNIDPSKPRKIWLEKNFRKNFSEVLLKSLCWET